MPFTLNAPEEIDPVRGTASAGEERTMTVVVGGQQRIVDYTNLPTFNDPDGRTMRTLRMMGGTVVKIYIDPLLEAMRGSEGQFRDIVHDNADAILAAVALLTEGYGSANPPQERCQDFTLTVDGPGGAKCDLQVSTCADKDPGGGVVATIEQASLGDCR
ncbi:MAG: hypothetical protein FJ125_18680 [Deltaproteobacteria bacterium]|nr:hypothetical protein [Deltaproteobacteria bacterium]